MPGSLSDFTAALSRTTGFLFGNRYRVVINKISGNTFDVFCSRVELPSLDYTPVDFDIGGKIVHTPNKLALGDLQLTFYNTGDEIKKFYEFCDSNIYIRNSHSIGYYDDTAMEITVYEYNFTNEAKVTRKFEKCILKSISPLTLSYNEATEVQSFTVGFTCAGMIVS